MRHIGAPSLFCMAMECSGVSIISEPSTGEANCTPSSVMLARCSSDTICRGYGNSQTGTNSRSSAVIKTPQYLVEKVADLLHIEKRMVPSISQAAELVLENIHAYRTCWKGCLYMCQDVLPHKS